MQLAVDASDPDRLAEALRTATKAEIDEQCPVYGQTALHTSVTSSHRAANSGRREPAREACCKALIDAGADLNVRELFGQTPLALAAISNAPQDVTITMLVEARADLLTVDSAPERPPHEPTLPRPAAAPSHAHAPSARAAQATGARRCTWQR